ncbi:MAG TPA: PHB depolymerase family esterase [Geminicoccaceae bacterium]|jgi:poly(hydroxyalkanoate) depolymerase family esterase|nr:PHB depolymerase family esterase [Geminicoccaceae bacterium]
MNDSDMLEATRLTRAGRLTEATALLQRALRSGTVPDTAFEPSAEAANTPAGSGARLIDLRPETVELTDFRPSPRAGQASGAGASSRPTGPAPGTAPTHLPEALRGLLARVNAIRPEPDTGGLHPRAPGYAPEVVPDGGTFLAASFGNQAGSRAYKLYVPSGYRGQAIPLVVMLHGCTQSPDDFAAGTRMNVRAEEKTCLVAYPAQAAAANASRCWNWFRPSDQQRGQGEPSLIAGITRQIMRDYAVDPERVYVAGLSAGAAAAAIMGMTYPDLYAAIGVHSGLAYGAAGDLPSAFAAMRQGEAVAVRRSGECRRLVPTIVFHGDQDSTVHPRNGDHVIAQSRASAATGLQTSVEQGRVPGGHTYSRTLHTDARGQTILEQWVVHGHGHAWSGGSPAGSFTDPQGPDATREMLRFFLEHRHPHAARPVASD